MKEHLQSELSRLMGMPSSKLNIAIEEAEEELQFILLASKYSADPIQEDNIELIQFEEEEEDDPDFPDNLI